jgi:hypothetical protein
VETTEHGGRIYAPPRAYWICTSDPIADVPEREAALRQAGGDAWAALDRLVDVR